MSATLPKRVSRGLRSWLKRNPFDDLQEEMNELISQFSTGWDGEPGTDMRLPSVDVAETDKAVEVKLDVPGFKPEEINVEMRGNTLFITGEHKEEKEEKNKQYHRIERRSGSIQRVLTMPTAVDAEKIAAQCRDGVLTVTLPKTEQAPTKKIAVKA